MWELLVDWVLGAGYFLPFPLQKNPKPNKKPHQSEEMRTLAGREGSGELWGLPKTLLRVKENIWQSVFESSDWKNKAIKKHFSLEPQYFRLFILWLATYWSVQNWGGKKRNGDKWQDRGIAVPTFMWCGRGAWVSSWPSEQSLWNKLGLCLLEVPHLWVLRVP